MVKRLISLKLALTLLLGGGLYVAAGTAEIANAASAAQIDARVQNTLGDFRRKVKGADMVLSQADGVLVFPGVYQGGFGIGGSTDRAP